VSKVRVGTAERRYNLLIALPIIVHLLAGLAQVGSAWRPLEA
jgi:hypothetical protein